MPVVEKDAPIDARIPAAVATFERLKREGVITGYVVVLVNPEGEIGRHMACTGDSAFYRILPSLDIVKARLIASLIGHEDRESAAQATPPRMPVEMNLSSTT